MRTFSRRLLAWFEEYGRRDLPWQQNPTPYRIWVSEIMLQQTQVTTVIPYYQRFMQRFPDLATLAGAPLDDVLKHWSGLGYYARARNLQKAAQQIMERHAGDLPGERETLEALPGIGRSTAGAILSIAFKQPAAILDGNVKRVLTRYHAVAGWPGKSAIATRLWEIAPGHTPVQRVAAYTQAIMDLGATVCTRSSPNCAQCPLKPDCEAFRQGDPSPYPTPKPRKQRPLKTRRFLIIENPEKRILLIRRPPAGIWGGLWSLPELESGPSISAHLQSTYQLRTLQTKKWPALRHQFTHFELKIIPVHAEVEYAPSRCREMANDALFWYNTRHSPPGGLPTPVVKLLQQYSRIITTDQEE